MLEQIDALGLGPTEQQYLMILAEGDDQAQRPRQHDRPAATHARKVTEPFLIRAGLMVKDDKGRRQLTALGPRTPV